MTIYNIFSILEVIKYIDVREVFVLVMRFRKELEAGDVFRFGVSNVLFRITEVTDDVVAFDRVLDGRVLVSERMDRGNFSSNSAILTPIDMHALEVLEKVSEVRKSLKVPFSLANMTDKDAFDNLHMGAPSPSGALNVGFENMLFAQVTNPQIAEAIITLFNNANFLLSELEGYAKDTNNG